MLQVVTLIDPSNAYGGPVRVAVNQTRTLRHADHYVELIASSRGFGVSVPDTFDGTKVLLFPAYAVSKRLGFAGLISPRMLVWLWANVKNFDVVHVHLARDLVVLPAAFVALMRRVPVVLQTHGMVDASQRIMAKLLDKVLTLRVLRSAAIIFALTNRERNDLLAVHPKARNIRLLPNGVPQPARKDWREALTTDVEVLYMARLHSRKRPEMFVRMAEILASKYPEAQFRLVGPDEGEGSKINRRIEQSIGANVSWEGAIAPSETSARLRRAAVYVLPSVNEPFPMSVLEAMVNGVPSVVTDSCGLAPALKAADAGIVCDESLDSLVDAVNALLQSDTYRLEMGARAARLAASDFSIEAVGQKLTASYASVVGGENAADFA